VSAVLGPAAEAIARWLGFAGTVLLVGALVFPSSAALQTGQAEEERRRVRWLALVGGVTVLLSASLRLVQQGAAFADTPGEWRGMVPTIVAETIWGRAWALQVGAAALLLLTNRGPWWASSPRRVLRWAVAGVLCAAPAFSGHAIGSERLTAAAVVADAVHVFASGVWIGGLAAIALAFVSSSELAPSTRLFGILTRFSPLAMLSVATLGVTGVFAAWLHVPSISLLLTSTYGRLLLLKLAVVLVVAGLGAYHWRVATPRLQLGAGIERARHSIAVEAMAGFMALAVTAILVSTPLPGEP
jgi:putative copper export protein